MSATTWVGSGLSPVIVSSSSEVLTGVFDDDIDIGKQTSVCVFENSACARVEYHASLCSLTSLRSSKVNTWAGSPAYNGNEPGKCFHCKTSPPSHNNRAHNL